MTYRTPLEYFCFDKVDKINVDVPAAARITPKKLKKMPFGAISWTLRNTGGFPILYALSNTQQKHFTYWETLDPDVTVVQDTIPRYIYYANSETTLGNDSSLYFEVIVPEEEKERMKDEAGMLKQLRDTLGPLKRLFPRLFGGL